MPTTHVVQVKCPRPAKRARLDEGGGKEEDKEDDAEGQGAIPYDPQLAFVFSHDVARFIVALLDHTPAAGASRADAVNLGCELQPNLREFLTLLGKASGNTDQPRFAAEKRPRSFLPSVDRPWPLDWRHLSGAYNFTATPLEDVLRSCADWFEQACTDFPAEAKRAAAKLPGEASEVAMRLAGLELGGKSSSSSAGGDSSDSSSS